jgi:hypothetical protein
VSAVHYLNALVAGINGDLIQSACRKAPQTGKTKMRSKTKTALAALLLFGSGSAVLVSTNNWNDHHGSVYRRALSVTMSSGVAGTVKPFKAEAKPWFAAPQLALAQRAALCRLGIPDTTMAWIKLTEPGGNLIHINVEQVTSVRSGTQIPGAKAQLDLASGKLQGVQENVNQVMQLIRATASSLANGECA